MQAPLALPEDAVRSLLSVFERARFSVEPMGESEKRSAIAALEQLRGRVAG